MRIAILKTQAKSKILSPNTSLEFQKSKISSPKLKSEILTSPNPNIKDEIKKNKQKLENSK